MLTPLSDWLADPPLAGPAAYTYQGYCPSTGRLLTLERTPQAEAVARELMRRLGRLEKGRMYGVLITDQGVLIGFSGQEQSQGWVPPIRPHELPEKELAELAELKAELAELPLPLARHALELLQQERASMSERHRLNKQIRAQKRLQGGDLELLRQESLADERKPTRPGRVTWPPGSRRSRSVASRSCDGAGRCRARCTAICSSVSRPACSRARPGRWRRSSRATLRAARESAALPSCCTTPPATG